MSVGKGLQWMKKYVKEQPVLTVAFLCAVVSMFWVPPSPAYLDYIDFRVLILLFGLMAVMAGFQKLGVFSAIAQKLLLRVKDTRMLAMVLVDLCFFFSMWITNDVALITFVPFAVMLLGGVKAEQQEKNQLLITVIVLQTLAANLGSMLTPIGNPQNLYLYGLSGMGVGVFVWKMLPWTALSFLMLQVSLLTVPRYALASTLEATASVETADLQGVWKLSPRAKLCCYLMLFVICLLTVFHVVSHWILLPVVLCALLLVSPGILRRVDYGLLLTFCSFFVLIGNIGAIPAIRDWFSQIMTGREVLVGTLASQFMSNVPAALLLSGFTTQYDALLLGVNFGGLGTLIASLASLISYQTYAKVPGSKTGRYMLQFTVWNVVFLSVLLGVWALGRGIG